MDRIDYEAIVRVLAGTAEADEVASVTRWRAESPANRECFDRIVEVWQVRLPARWSDTDVAWQRLAVRLSDASATRPSTPAAAESKASRPAARRPSRSFARRPSRSKIVPVLRAAGIAGLLVTSAAGTWWYTSPLVSRIQTAAGVREELRLPDRSRVTLGPESQLRGSGRFSRLRRVELTGSAYFDVVHDSSRPFVVETGSGSVEVLGTAFTVDTRGTRAEAAIVAVHRGRVRVDATPLEAGEEVAAGGLARVQADGTLDVDYPPDLSEFSSLHTGKLVFRATPLAVVAEKLARWYGVPLRVDSTIGEFPVTLEVTDEPMSLVADLLAAATGSQVRTEGSSLQLIEASPDHRSPHSEH